MVSYSYVVNQNGALSTIQMAIDMVVTDLASGDPLTQDIEILVEDGVYPGFIVPDGGTLSLMGSVYRLVIKSAGDYFPILDFNLSPDTNYVGIDIKSANPNITVENLKTQFFAVGIRFATNSHSPKVRNCLVTNSRNVGIFIDQCSNAQVLQSIVANGDFGIVTRQCKGAALIHNTIFLNGSISSDPGVALSAIWCQLANNYGAGVADTGKLHLIGNIAWNTVGTTLTLFSDDVEQAGSVLSNYNDLVVGNTSKFISIEDRAFSAESTSRGYINSLSSWKSRGFDLNSKSIDPRFISSSVSSTNRQKHSINLALVTSSPVNGVVPVFATDAAATAAWLPSYVNSADLSRDILGNVRSGDSSSIGANNKTSSSRFFDEDILISPVEDLKVAECGSDPLAELISRRMELWYPRFKTGYFYSYDREFYLYAKKGFAFLGELAVTEFNLPVRVDIRKAVTLKVNGSIVTTANYLDVVGDRVYFYHRDLNIFNGNEEIEIAYSTAALRNSATPAMQSSRTLNRFKISDGRTRYFLPNSYVPAGPVVLTDDTSYHSNSDLVCNREFATVFDNQFQLSEIILHNSSNLVSNPQFDYFPSGLPLQWSSSGSVVVEGQHPRYPVAGGNYCRITGNGYIRQELPVTSGNSVLSCYAASSHGTTGEIRFSFYDGFNRDLGYSITRSFNTTDDWNRFYVTVGPTGVYSRMNIQEDYPTIELGRIDIPPNAAKATVDVRALGTGYLCVDATQFEHKYYPSYYHRVPYGNEITVEYETSSQGSFIDSNQALTSSVTTQSEGFLYIPELPASALYGPQLPSITTLHEWRWADGRKNFLPWGRLTGKDKLRRRTISSFHDYPQKILSIDIPSMLTPRLKEISINPPVILTQQGDRPGAVFSVNVIDTNGNPLNNAAYEIFVTDSSQKFPGWLHKKLFGAKQQLGQSVLGRLDGSGSTCVTWIPPDAESFILNIPTPRPSTTAQNGQAVSIIRTKYPVNLDSGGNVTILDQLGNVIPTIGSLIQGFYNPRFSEGQSVISLEYPVQPGSLQLTVAGKALQESFTSSPDSNQFYVENENGLVYLKGRQVDLFVEYVPQYTYINQSDLYKIALYHDKVFAGYDGNITLSHDATIKLTVAVTDYSTNKDTEVSFDLIALSTLNRSQGLNKASLEM
jgi:hypothetical protein